MADVSNFIKQVFQHNSVIKNYAYMSVADIVSLLAPFLTYPYLIRTLGSELFGWTITAQALATYASLFVNYGFNSVSGRYVALYNNDKEKLSEIISSITTLRLLFCVVAFLVYMIIVWMIPSYRSHLLLFSLSFGYTFDFLLFPQFYFQGMEKMKYISLVKIIIKVVTIALTFIIIEKDSDYFKVPLIYAIGSIIAGLVCYYLIAVKDAIKWKWLKWQQMKFYMKDATPIFCTELISSIKNQSNYLFITALLGPALVVVYDVATKLQGILVRPTDLLNIVLFPKMSRSHNNKMFLRIGIFILIVSIFIYLVVNLCLPFIVRLLIGQDIELTPIRVYLLTIIIMMTSKWIISSLFVARGKNRLVMYSMIFTTLFYIVVLGLLYILGILHSLNVFVAVIVFTYLAELSFNLYYTRKILLPQNNQNETITPYH